jgi:hypothetical protein
MSEWFDPAILRRPGTWVAVAVPVIAVILLGVLMGSFWTGLGDTGMSAAGWVALVLGAVVTLALGVGLMALVFISSRRGFDEPDGNRGR